MWGKQMIPIYRLWLHSLYGLYGPCHPLSPERLKNVIIHSPPWLISCCFQAFDWSSRFHAFADKPMMRLSSNLMGKLIMGLFNFWSRSSEFTLSHHFFVLFPHIDYLPIGFKSNLEDDIINSPPSAAYTHQWMGSALFQIMACCLFGAKPLSKPMLGYCELDP